MNSANPISYCLHDSTTINSEQLNILEIFYPLTTRCPLLGENKPILKGDYLFRSSPVIHRSQTLHLNALLDTIAHLSCNLNAIRGRQGQLEYDLCCDIDRNPADPILWRQRLWKLLKFHRDTDEVRNHSFVFLIPLSVVDLAIWTMRQ